MRKPDQFEKPDQYEKAGQYEKTDQHEERASAKMAPNDYQRDATDASTMAPVRQWPVAPDLAGLLGYFA